MDKLEKIDRLRERASVSYEEAKEALERSDEDLLDAIVYLERQGKVRKPEQSTYSTQYEEQKEYIRVADKVEEQKQSAPSLGGSIGRLARMLFSLIFHSTFHITKGERSLLTLPTFAAAILLLIFWKAALPVGLAALLFGVRYSFEGENSTHVDTANGILSRAGDIADSIGSGLQQDVKKSAEE